MATDKAPHELTEDPGKPEVLVASDPPRRAHGLDVSSVQDGIKAIAWPTVALQDSPESPRIEYVFAQATRGIGDDVDAWFESHAAGVRSISRLFGAYHWWVFSRDPVEQAACFERAIVKVGGVDLPPAVDFEYPTPDKWLEKNFDPTAAVVSIIKIGRELQRRLGRKPVLYTYLDFMSHIVAHVNSELIAEMVSIFDLWIAGGPHYLKPELPREDADTPDIPNDAEQPPHILSPWSTYSVWQFSGGIGNEGGVRVPGIVGLVDRNLFNGDVAALREWAGLAAA